MHKTKPALGLVEINGSKAWPYTPTDPLLSPPSPQNIPAVPSVDDRDAAYSDIYNNAAFIYRYTQDVYLMLPALFRHTAPRRQPWFRFQPGNDYGLIEVQMAVSRDGFPWDRPDRRPYFPMGLPNEWDWWLAMMGVSLISIDTKFYQHYLKNDQTHDSGILRPDYDKTVESECAIGALRQRLHGFVSADFSHAGGPLPTPPLVFSGTHLQLSIDTGGMGTAFIEIRNAQGKPIPGFTRGECEEIGDNFLDTPVRWKGKADLSALRERPIVL